MGKWKFSNCTGRNDIIENFDNNWKKTKQHIGCSCGEDTLEYDVEIMSPDPRYKIIVKCGSCGKNRTIYHDPS